MIETILNWALPFIVAPITVLVGRLIMNARREIDALPAWLKQAVVSGIAMALTLGAGYIGGAEALCGGAAECTLENLDVKAAVAAALAFAIHNGLKKPTRS